MTTNTNTQSRILSELDAGALTDMQLAVKLGTTLHGVRAALIALHRKGVIRKRKHEDAFSWEWEKRHGKG